MVITFYATTFKHLDSMCISLCKRCNTKFARIIWMTRNSNKVKNLTGIVQEPCRCSGSPDDSNAPMELVVRRSAFCFLLSTFRVPRSAFCVLCSAFCVPHSAFCVRCSIFGVRRSKITPAGLLLPFTSSLYWYAVFWFFSFFPGVIKVSVRSPNIVYKLINQCSWPDSVHVLYTVSMEFLAANCRCELKTKLACSVGKQNF